MLRPKGHAGDTEFRCQFVTNVTAQRVFDSISTGSPTPSPLTTRVKIGAIPQKTFLRLATWSTGV